MDSLIEILNEAEKYRQNDEYDLAILKYNDAIASIYASRGEVFGLLQNYEKEIEDFLNAMKLTSDSWLKNHLHFMCGMAYLQLKQFDKAYFELDLALKDTPTFQHYFFRGLALEGLKDYEGARKDYITTLSLYPSHVPARNALMDLEKKLSGQ